MPSLLDRLKLTPTLNFIVFGVVLAAIFWWTSTDPQAKWKPANENLRKQLAIAEKKLRETEDRFHNKAKFQEEMERVSQLFKLALDYLPKELDIQDILKKIYLEARSSGIELTEFKPKEPVSKDFYDELPMEVSLKGTYAQLLTFLAHVSKIPRIINIRNVEISNPVFTEGIPVMKLSGVLVGYRYKEPKPKEPVK